MFLYDRGDEAVCYIGEISVRYIRKRNTVALLSSATAG